MLLAHLLRHVVRKGALRLIDGRGREHIIGDRTEPRCTVRVHERRLDYTLALNPSLRFGEAYMDGAISIEDGDLSDFLEVVLENYGHLERHPLMRIAKALHRETRGLKQYNPMGKARRNVAHHYDLSKELYALFLDRDRQYSCAYFIDSEESLEQAQRNKLRHLAAKLLLEPGVSVLDVGSGWGGLGLYLAKVAQLDVVGLTLSAAQHEVSNERARREGLSDRVRFHLKDYRDETNRYDRLVSVGMLEHVGKRHYDEFFRKVRDLLSEEGVAVVQSIGRLDEPAPVNPFIRKYIFPGTDVPSLSEILPAVERSGLIATDIEILRLHYAETLKRWRRRFRANWERVKKLYDERFCRMWDFYLAGCEMGFRHQGLMVFQLQLAKKLDTVPLTRDYIYEWERSHSDDALHVA